MENKNIVLYRSNKCLNDRKLVRANPLRHLLTEKRITVLKAINDTNSLYSSDALRYFHWLKKLRALERERDSLCIGLQVLDQAQFWYQYQLEQMSLRRVRIGKWNPKEEDADWSCALRSRMQRVNGCLGSLLNNTCLWSSVAPDEKDGSDWDLRWTNTTLTQEVAQKNLQISVLELEKQLLIQHQDGSHNV